MHVRRDGSTVDEEHALRPAQQTAIVNLLHRAVVRYHREYHIAEIRDLS
jgi:hypothetical protein